MNEIDLSTGAMTTPVSVWNGTGGASPEGPHVYKRNGWYYLMIAEGGTELGHMETIARSRNIMGPYEAYANNPILSNANTTQYFQTVGHADLFQDSAGLWWGVALATRSGPDWFIYPMGRETVLYPVTWDGEWPVLSPVRGIMDHAPLPPANKNVSGDGPFVNDPDVIDFLPGSSIPLHFYSQRYPPTPDTFQVSPPGHPNTLQVIPSRTNMTGIPCSRGCSELSGIDGISFISRKQTHTSFSYSVEMDFQPTTAGQEAGITVFRTQRQHIDLTLAHTSDPKCDRQLHFRIEATGAKNATSSLQSFAWPYPGSVLLEVRTANDSYYAFSAAPASDPSARTIVGYASGRIVSGGAGSFIGALLGVFSTCNGGSGVGNACSEAHGGKAWFGKWRYTGAAQKVDHDEYVPSWE
jgi:beta-xylosidase